MFQTLEFQAKKKKKKKNWQNLKRNEKNLQRSNPVRGGKTNGWQIKWDYFAEKREKKKQKQTPLLTTTITYKQINTQRIMGYIGKARLR